MADPNWTGDLLGRQKDAEFLIEFLKRRHAERKKAGIKGAYVLNVNAEWGFGKSYFLRGMAEDLRGQHPVVMIDAWKNDFSDDPYTMVLSEIDAFFQPLIKKVPASKGKRLKKAYTVVKQHSGKLAWMGVKGMARKGAEKFFGSAVQEASSLFDSATDDGQIGDAADDIATAGIEEVGDGLQAGSMELFDRVATSLIGQYQEVKQSQENFKESLQVFLKAFDAVDKKYTLPMFVFIDELDRCRPPYAIALLERIKHLFDVDDIVFVIATDTKQLSHSITGFYGSNFDGHNYLHRFFTRTFLLPRPSTWAFIASMIGASGVDMRKWNFLEDQRKNVSFLASASDRFGAGLRDIQRAMDILFDLTTSWEHPFPIEIGLMFPLILGYLKNENIDDLGDAAWLNKRLVEVSRPGWPLRDIASEETARGVRLEGNVDDLIRGLMRAAKEDFHQHLTSLRERAYAGRSSGDAVTRMVGSTLEKEYHARFQNVVLEGQKTKMSEYPGLIKYAGYTGA